MIKFSRRQFLKALAASTGLVLTGKNISSSALSADPAVFDLLVVGDSIIWGQGLDEKDKFYTLTAGWLRTDAFQDRRKVDLKVKAHSGSNVKYHPDEAEKHRRAGRDETHFYKPEVNVGFPSIWKQVETAADEYKAEGKSGGADLIMVTGGITDISVAKLLDPFKDKERLYALIAKFCRDDMFDMMEHALRHHPRATIAVIGYYPIVSPKTPGSRMFNTWLESMGFPRPLKPVANNPITRKLIFSRLKARALARSRIWYAESNKNLQTAVDQLNAKHGKTRAVFIKSPIDEDSGFETPNTLLFRMGKKGVVEDPLFHERTADCRQSLSDLKKAAGIKYPVRLCEIAAVGHPNPAGSRAYAEAIKAALSPLLSG